ncbi:helix-turn-helix domain-containing protein [Streptomyces sp. WAC01526]|uniref:helix-turn-helix domain-containing protein n=1 Tax=Streptomyces sp. WAC01526 TaxID=2588709 RepID=UPI0011DFE78B|nr:helix-turn-helix domain-containing protein [Streptomyces sp. WAC01526]
MSDTTSDSTPTQNPTPEPLTGLTDAQAAIYTELVGLTEPATVIEIALAAGVGKSTAGRALPLLEQRGLAVRTPGGHNGPCRMPDVWYPTPPAPAPVDISGEANRQAPEDPQPEPSIADTPEPDSDNAVHEETPHDETAPKPPTSPDIDSTDTTIGEDNNAPQAAVAPQDTAHSGGGNSCDNGLRSEDDNDSSALEESPESQPVLAQPITLPDQKKRLAPGALRQMVVDHLHAHPDEAFTATKISRVIEKSSGAIANSLATLVRLGVADQVSDTPRTFRLASSARAGNTP